MSELTTLTEMLEHHYNERENKKSKAAQAELRKIRLMEQAREAEDLMNATIQRIQSHNDLGDNQRLDIDKETGEVSIVGASE